jgi:membrane protease YdiL (CAAX protease family)
MANDFTPSVFAVGPETSITAPDPAERRRRWKELGLVLLVAFGIPLFTALYLLRFPYALSLGLTGLRAAAGLKEEGSALLVLGYVLSRRGLNFANLGFEWSFADGLVGILLAAIAYATYLFVFWAERTLHIFVFASPLVLRHGWEFGSLTLTLILFSLYNPFFEELIVRAYLMTEIVGLTGSTVWAVILSVAVQGSYHLYYGWVGASLVTCNFLVFAISYARFRRAFPVIVAHACIDLIRLLRHL